MVLCSSHGGRSASVAVARLSVQSSGAVVRKRPQPTILCSAPAGQVSLTCGGGAVYVRIARAAGSGCVQGGHLLSAPRPPSSATWRNGRLRPATARGLLRDLCSMVHEPLCLPRLRGGERGSAAALATLRPDHGRSPMAGPSRASIRPGEPAEPTRSPQSPQSRYSPHFAEFCAEIVAQRLQRRQ